MKNIITNATELNNIIVVLFARRGYYGQYLMPSTSTSEQNEIA